MNGDTLAVIIGLIALAVVIASEIIVRRIRSEGRNSLVEIYGKTEGDEKKGVEDGR